ncbi:MAG TPA: hypothetical protein VFX97_08055 [Pyrinomonadaceae bacterium]|nr:hypothetical protein [Pyrinomonadaceae bacterium]
MNVKSVLLGSGVILSMAATGFIVAKVSPVPAPAQGFTVHTRDIVDPGDGRPTFIAATSIRYQKADGSWRQDRTYMNGRTDVGFKLAGKGVFRVDEGNKKLDYLSSADQNHFHEDRARQDPGFVREETILGFKTFVVRKELAATGEITEYYICPALQGYMMKVVIKSKSGWTNTFEATKVELGDPPEHLFTSLPNYEVDYENFKQKRAAAAGPNDQK